MRRPDIDPVEIVAIWVPVLTHAAVAAFAVGVACMWVVILSGKLPV